MLNRKIRYKQTCEINIVPFLDILLVLLLMFMISTPVVTQNFEVNLPNSSHSTSIKKNNISEITIEILGNDRYNIFMNYDKIKNISSDQMSSEIFLKNNTKLTDIIFLIAAAHDVSYNEVIKTLNFLYKIGVHKVNILTNPISSNN